MVTYFVNASGSNTSPFDTPAKGADNFSNLITSIGGGPYSDDTIVEVVAGSEILESGVTINNEGHDFTVRSYGNADGGGKDAEDIDRYVHKPILKSPPGASTFYFSGGAGGAIFKNIRLYKDQNDGRLENWFINKPEAYVAATGCEFMWRNRSTTGFPPDYYRDGGGIWSYWGISAINCIFANCKICIFMVASNLGWLTVVNSVFYNCADMNIRFDAGGGGSGGPYFFVNNTFDYGGVILHNVSGTADYNNFYHGADPFGSHVVNQDPDFINPSSGNFNLNHWSPCVNNGANPTQYSSVPVIDYDGNQRPYPVGGDWDIGAYECVNIPISYFSSSTVVDGTAATSIITPSYLVSKIQASATDPYFDSTSKIDKVLVYYTSSDGRQTKRVIHSAPALTGTVTWHPFIAGDGTWSKSQVKVYDPDGAMHVVPRAIIGSGEDLTHSDGTMNLNS